MKKGQPLDIMYPFSAFSNGMSLSAPVKPQLHAN